MITCALLPKYQSFWHVLVHQDLKDPRKGRCRAQIMEVAYNTDLGENIYYLEVYSKQAKVFGTPYNVYIPAARLKIVRLESQIISRA